MHGYIEKLLKSDKIRYLIVGGCTTLVNFIVFFGLRLLTPASRNLCNVIAIICAILFAYVTNKYFVFESKNLGIYKTIVEAILFVAGRIVSMVVEVLGFAILCDSFRLKELFSKIFVQFVVIVINYVISKLFVFRDKRRSFIEIVNDNYCYFLAFIISFVTMIAIFIVQRIAPFGTHSMTIVDSIHQYIPFYSELRDKLLNEGSLFYSWNIALGSNFVSLAAYYLSSPFNLLFLIFGKESIIAVACIVMAIKISLCSVTMVHFLSYKDGEKKRNLIIVAIAISYAFSNYVVGYFWNSMWLDCLIALPLIMLGFKRLVEEKDIKLYVLSLFYALYCNYYIGYIICVFLVLWFITYNHKSIKNFFNNGIRFAVASLMSGGMAAFLLLPAYFGIKTTAAGEMKLPKSEWYGNIFVLIKQQFFLTDPITNQNFDGGVNLFCGTLAIISIALYLISNKAKLFDKIRYVFLLVVLMISFNNVLPNYIWHGMHDQYGIPNRFSFLYIFILLIMTYDVLQEIRSYNIPLILAGTMFTVAATIYCNTQSKLSKEVIIGTAVFLTIYTVILCLGTTKKIKRDAFVYIISGVCVIEMLISGVSGYLENGYSDAAKYYSTSKNVTAAYNKVKKMAKEEGPEFYRAELMDSTVLDEASWHNMPSVGTFCSTVNGNAVTAMGKLGFYTGANEFLYMGSTPFTNSLLNVKYLLKREDDYDNFDFNHIDDVEGVGIYTNPYPLSIGFGVSTNVKEHTMSGNSFVVQNALSNVMMYAPSFFTVKEDLSLMTSSEQSTTRIEGNKVYYTPDEKGEVRVNVSFYVNEPGDYYVECRGNSINKIRFSVDEKELTYDRYMWQIFHLGKLEKDQYVSIEYYFKSVDPVEKNLTLNVATFDESAYQEFYTKAKSSMLKVDKYEDGYIHGDVVMQEDQILFTSIPYDLGWEVYVDGRKTEFFKVLQGFIGVDIEPGKHTIEMKYTPVGLNIGIIISAIAWVLFIGIILLNGKNKTKSMEKEAK